MTNELVIETKNLSRHFGKVVAVDQLNLAVKKSTIYGFLGPNGCGKSTTIRMLCGLLSPTSGEVEVLNMKVPQEAEKLRLKVGYMTQKFSLYDDLTVEENLRFMGQIYGMASRQLKLRIEFLLDHYALVDRRKQRAGSMSGGQRQRLALAAATLHQPPLLFLDEPTSAVDPENRRDFWEKLFDLCDQGTSILVSTHYMDEAERCHQLAILERGQLKAQGSPAKLMEEMGASVIEIGGQDLRQLKKRLLQLDKVRSAAQQGLRLRVLVDGSVNQPLEWLESEFSHQKLELNSVRPSLEDVFVSATSAA